LLIVLVELIYSKAGLKKRKKKKKERAKERTDERKKLKP
jgi:hypothetical protein